LSASACKRLTGIVFQELPRKLRRCKTLLPHDLSQSIDASRLSLPPCGTAFAF
jgi:hypothetical protein